MTAAAFGAAAVVAGLGCGWLNARILATAIRKLAAEGKPKPFVLSSFFRVGACAIVAGVFAAVGPWWSMALFLVALFVPLVILAANSGAYPNEKEIS